MLLGLVVEGEEGDDRSVSPGQVIGREEDLDGLAPFARAVGREDAF